MSIRAIQAVWDRSEAGGSMRLLLLALADFADEDGLAWPSVATLCHRVGRNERRIQQLIAAAIEAGELEADRSGGRGTSRYRLRPGGEPVRERGVQSTAPQGRSPRHPRGAADDTPGAQRAAPKPSVEPLEEPEPRARGGNHVDEPVDEAIAAYSAYTQRLDASAADPVVRYHELTDRFPSERIREWLNDVARQWGDERTADALTEAAGRQPGHRGLIGRAVDVMNEQEHEAERSRRDASRAAAAGPPRPEQSDEEKAAIIERNAAAARATRAQLLADGRVSPTRPGDEELMREEIERRRTPAATVVTEERT